MNLGCLRWGVSMSLLFVKPILLQEKLWPGLRSGMAGFILSARKSMMHTYGLNVESPAEGAVYILFFGGGGAMLQQMAITP